LQFRKCFEDKRKRVFYVRKGILKGETVSRVFSLQIMPRHHEEKEGVKLLTKTFIGNWLYDRS